MAFEQFDTRELFARLLQCEAGGEGENGMTLPSSLPILLPQRIPTFEHDTPELLQRLLPISNALIRDPAAVVIDRRPDASRRPVRHFVSIDKLMAPVGSQPRDLVLHLQTPFWSGFAR